MFKKELFACCLFVSISNFSYAQYDPEMLKLFGIDPALVEQLESGNVIEGENTFPIFVNGEEKGVIKLNYLRNNNFYIDKSIVNELGLINNLTEGEQNTFLDNYPESKIIYENAAINIFTDSENIQKEFGIKPQSGFGAFLNYILEYDKELRTEEDEASDVVSANISMGVNFNGYLYRNNITYNNVSDKISINYNYIQKNFIDYKKVIKIGDIYTLNPYHASTSILGAQIGSDSYFISTARARVVGTVSTQSRIEIYINETLKIYETTVPSGYYELDDVYLPLATNEIRVVEIGQDGSFNEKFEPVQQIGFNLTDEVEFAVTAGVANQNLIDNDRTDSSIYDSWVVSGYTDLYKQQNLKLTTGALVADDYYFAGLGYVQNGIKNIFLDSFSIESGISYDSDEYGDGYYGLTSLNATYFNDYNLNIYGRIQSEDYRTLESLPNNFEKQYSVSLAMPLIGFDYASFGYNKSFIRNEDDLTSYTVILTRTFDNDSSISIDGYYDSNDEWNTSITYSIPLNSHPYHTSLDASAFLTKDSTTYETNLNGAYNDYNYGLSLTKDQTNSEASVSATVDRDFKDVEVSTGLFASGGGVENGFISLEGGIAYSDGNYDFTSETIGDTFAFVEINDYDNVEIEAGSSDILTSNGIAVIPDLEPYEDNQIIVQTHTLPKNTTLRNGYQEINLSYGSVGKVKIDTKPFYSRLIKIVDKNRKPIIQNTLIVSLDDEYITSVGIDGLIFFESEVTQNKYKAKVGKNDCFFDLSKSVKISNESKIEMVVCE